ncbi:hypothetical protein AB0N14_18875 [Streptomyces sp. NPDC051104]|uniref:hypothetical protein n=1 Tax=Streptomyces sp. NPDC051104 TaxID=3155044 RepID=UPI00343092F2
MSKGARLDFTLGERGHHLGDRREGRAAVVPGGRAPVPGERLARPGHRRPGQVRDVHRGRAAPRRQGPDAPDGKLIASVTLPENVNMHLFGIGVG